MIQHLPKRTLKQLSSELLREIKKRDLIKSHRLNPPVTSVPKDTDKKSKLSARQNKWLSDPQNRAKQNARRRAKYHADRLAKKNKEQESVS